ncbi:hypothetical protein GUA46_09105 [Muricauda sp. HICW]|uniref:Uncharacterized protein n=1 Tax=Flagellimonas chongwuensis TaxID=2697365 RepID=A0A850NF96_9FLAO|nr:hypothetical protein [Allomuricauda chongwuensis]NVN18499.1 hypothetical protein [Allomuricauda chongwuensis]
MSIVVEILIIYAIRYAFVFIPIILFPCWCERPARIYLFLKYLKEL